MLNKTFQSIGSSLSFQWLHLEKNSRLYEITSLMAVLVLALTLRLIFVTGVVFSDDIAYAQAAYYWAHGALYLEPWNGLLRLGLYAPVTVLYALFGVSDATTLAWPLLCSLLTVIVVYAIGKLLAGDAAGLISALLWAIFPLDIQLATALLPDGPLATFSAGAVLFFLLGERSQSRSAMLAYFACLVCLAVAMLIKPLAILLLVFFVTYLTWKRSSRRTWIFVTVSVVVMGMSILRYRSSYSPGEEAIVLLQSSGLVALIGTTTDWFRVLTQNPEFFVFAPLFIVVLAVSLAARQRNTIVPLLWAGSTFLYFELGSVSPFTYSPISSAMMTRHILLVMVPFILLTGIYLAQGLSACAARRVVVGLAVVLPIIAWFGGRGTPDLPARWLGLTAESQPFGIVSNLSAAIAIFGGVASPLFVQGFRFRWKTVAIACLLASLSLSILNPTSQLVSYPYKVTHKNITQAIKFINAQKSCYSLLAQNPLLAAQVNYRSGFSWGDDAFIATSKASNLKLGVVPEHVEQIGDACVLVDQVYLSIEQQVPPYILNPPQDWWEMARFGDYEGYQLILYRVLTPGTALQEMHRAQEAVSVHSGRNDLHRLMGAATNADDPCMMLLAWSRLRRLGETTAVADLRELASRCYSVQPEIAGTDLLHVDNWSWASGLSMSVYEEQVGEDDASLVWHLIGPDETRGMVQKVTLQPSTAYVFEAEVKSTAPLYVLYMEIPSELSVELDVGKTYQEWTSLSFVYVTPEWKAPQEVDLYPIMLKRAGEAWVKNVKLAELQMEKVK